MLDVFNHFMPQAYFDRLGALIPGHPILTAFPRLKTLLTSLGGKMPFSTQLLISFSEFALSFWGLALIVALYRKRQSAHVEDLTSLKL